MNEQFERIEDLVARIERSPDAETRAVARDLVSAVLALHAEGFARILEIVSSDPPRDGLTSALARDELVASLLSLHGLHPTPIEVRIRAALDAVGRELRASGAEAELVELADGAACVRIRPGSACGSSAVALRSTVEDAVWAAAPDLARLEIHDGTAADGSRLVTLRGSREATRP